MTDNAPRVIQVSRSVIEGGFDYHREIARGLAGAGADVCSVFQRGQLSPEATAAFPGRVVCLDSRRRRIYKKPIGLALALWRATQGRPCDLAVCHHLTPARAVHMLVRTGRVKRAALIVHDYDYFDPDDYHGKRRNRFVKRLLHFPWQLVGVSHAICSNVLCHVPELAARRCRVIHNAIDADSLKNRLMSRMEARRALGLEAGDYVFGTIGRLVAFKAHDDLIEAFARSHQRMPNARLIIIGRGPLDANLRQQVASAGMQDRIVIHGFLEDAARYLSAFDTFVLPSRHEPFGLVLLEAMVCGVPVVASDSGATREILPPAARLFPTGDREALAQCLVEAYCAPQSDRDAAAVAGSRQAEALFSLRDYRAAYAGLLDAQAWET